MYFIPGYAETLLVKSVDLSSSAPTGIKGLAAPAGAGTPPAVAGAIFWNAYDAVNENYYVYDSKTQLVVVNTDDVDSIKVTVRTKSDTVAGFTRDTEDLTETLAPGEIWFSGLLPNIFSDAQKVKVLCEDVAAGNSLDMVFLATIKAS